MEVIIIMVDITTEDMKAHTVKMKLMVLRFVLMVAWSMVFVEPMDNVMAIQHMDIW